MPFFFAFLLLDTLLRYPVLLNILKSVWNPKKILILLFLLFVILMYIFTVFAYYFLWQMYPPGYCSSTWVCLLTALDKSFKTDGAIGGYLEPINFFDNDYNFMLRFFFDNIYFLLIMVIMLNILLGIIIDTFGSLRAELKAYTWDRANICFICGFDREMLEKVSNKRNGFVRHIKDDHYMWNYLFYIAYLFEKDSSDFTGIESYVREKVDKQDISWFPYLQYFIF